MSDKHIFQHVFYILSSKTDFLSPKNTSTHYTHYGYIRGSGGLEKALKWRLFIFILLHWTCAMANVASMGLKASQ